MSNPLWNNHPFVVVASDTKSGALPANLGVEQIFGSQNMIEASILSAAPGLIRGRLHLAMTTATTGPLLGGVATACALRLRLLLGGSVVGNTWSGGVVLGDTNQSSLGGVPFAITALGMTAAQVKIEYILRLLQAGTAGNSLLNAQGDGSILVGSGVPALGLSFPLIASSNLLDFTQPQTLFIGVTFASVAGANSLILTGGSMQYTS